MLDPHQRAAVAFTVAMADEDDGPWNLAEVTLAVAVSGFFTSYFAD